MEIIVKAVEDCQKEGLVRETGLVRFERFLASALTKSFRNRMGSVTDAIHGMAAKRQTHIYEIVRSLFFLFIRLMDVHFRCWKMSGE